MLPSKTSEASEANTDCAKKIAGHGPMVGPRGSDRVSPRLSASILFVNTKTTTKTHVFQNRIRSHFHFGSRFGPCFCSRNPLCLMPCAGQGAADGITFAVHGAFWVCRVVRFPPVSWNWRFAWGSIPLQVGPDQICSAKGRYGGSCP